ncbi:MAG: VOC family protein [Chloroflexi bacterium]|nr:VOC family protein [Chloroflexota bacterium]
MAAQDGADIEGVAGVIVWTDRYPEMLAFYRDVLGLAPRSERPTFANFEWGGFRLSVAAHDEVHGPARDPLRIMVHFKVPDIAAAHRHLADRGVAFSRPPEQERWGGWVATFADPDGNTLQLLQLPD